MTELLCQAFLLPHPPPPPPPPPLPLFLLFLYWVLYIHDKQGLSTTELHPQPTFKPFVVVVVVVVVEITLELTL